MSNHSYKSPIQTTEMSNAPENVVVLSLTFIYAVAMLLTHDLDNVVWNMTKLYKSKTSGACDVHPANAPKH